jgi:UDP-N-acetylmuramoyl-tripeptide--D-alanyl-D-alanine ligase
MLRAAGLYRASLLRRTRLYAVTGTFGKSTTVRALGAALGVPITESIAQVPTLISAHLLRTPPWQRRLVYEAGLMHKPARTGGLAPLVRALQPDVAVVTSIGTEHMTWSGSLEGTRAEKLKVVQALRPGGLAVLNGDDLHVLWMRERTAARVVTFGFDPANDVRASDYALDWPRGSRFVLELDGRRYTVRTRLLGRHFVYPILAALAAVWAEGLPVGPALAALEQLAPTRGRLEPVRLPNGAYLLRDDFKGSFETFQSALEVLAEIPARRRVLLLGDVAEPPGSVGAIYRQLGEQAARAATEVLLVGEQVRRYRTGLRRGGLPPEAVTLIPRGDVLEALRQLQGRLEPGDVVLLKGRGPQRLERVALGLLGRQVRCALRECPVIGLRCVRCDKLETGWAGQLTTLS